MATVSNEFELTDLSAANQKNDVENESAKYNDEGSPNDEKKVQVETKTEPISDEVPEEDGKMSDIAFAINLMKGIAGTGSLAIPNAVKSVGIVWGVVFFMIVGAAYIYSSYQLITMNNNLGAKRNIGRGIIHTSNDYARMCYIALGKPGYYLFNFALLMTLYGACIGTMIVMTDFLSSLPFMKEQYQLKRYLMQILLTIGCIILCMLKDPSLLVAISSFGLVALVASFVLLFIYGVTHYEFSWNVSYLWPTSLSDFLSKFGVFVYSLGFTLFLLSQIKHVKKECRKNVVRTISVSVAMMATIYCFIGIIFFLLLNTSPKGVSGNILSAIPEHEWVSMVISILMVITCIGGFPLYTGPIHEVVERSCGPVTTNKLFVTSKNHIIFRTVEIVLVSVIAALLPFFSDILSFIGNFSSVLVASVLPSTMYIIIMKDKISKAEKGLNIVIVIISTIVMIVCTVVSFKTLLDGLMK